MSYSWRSISSRMLNFILSSINRISAQTCNLRQVQNISLLVCQYANETPFVSFVQAYQYAIDCFVFFSDPAIRVQLTDFTWTVMKRFLWFIRHYVCPIFFKTSLSQIESAQVIFEQTLIVPHVSRNQRICIGGDEYFRKHDIVRVCVSFRGKRLRLNVTTGYLKMIDDSAFPF